LDLPLAIRAFEVLLGWSLLLQSAEYLRLRSLDRVGDWHIQRAEVPNAWVRQGLDILYRHTPYACMLWLRAALALVLMLGHAGPGSAVLLFVMALLLLRWRGAFNGGSDFMTLVGPDRLALGQSVGTFYGHRQRLACRALVRDGAKPELLLCVGLGQIDAPRMALG
jgi:hypothetical protein